MNSYPRMVPVALVLISILAIGCPSANASVYYFFQGGYSGGGTIIGTFEGTDLDSNGQLSSFDGEISSFSLVFAGDSVVSDFTHSLADLYALVYDLGSGYIGDGGTGDVEGIASNWGGISGFDYASGWGPIRSHGGRVIDVATGATSRTDQLVAVSGVPLPPAVLLLGSGLIGLIGFKRKILG